MLPAIRSRVLLNTWSTLGVAALSSGCAAPGPRGEIPLGRWAGHGVFAYEDWEPADEEAKPLTPRSVSRSYPTCLTIQPVDLSGHPVIVLEIRSDRGRLPQLEGEATHLSVAVLKVKRVSDAMVLYRVVGFVLDPGPGKPLRFDDGAPPFGASCTVEKGATVLQIEYGDNFVDTFRFAGNQLEKSGSYFNRKAGLIHWVEHLTRAP